MREAISNVSSIIVMISMLVFLMSIIWCIVRLFRRKKIKPSLILSASSIGAFILFTIIGATAWSGTEEYKIAMAEREQKEIEQEKLDKKEEALEKKAAEKKTEQDASAGKEQISTKAVCIPSSSAVNWRVQRNSRNGSHRKCCQVLERLAVTLCHRPQTERSHFWRRDT